jgi:hypothetical protein
MFIRDQSTIWSMKYKMGDGMLIMKSEIGNHERNYELLTMNS